MGGLGHNSATWTWRLHAHKTKAGVFVHIAREVRVNRYQEDMEVVRVLVERDEAGDYYGWYGGPSHLPTYLSPSEAAYEAAAAGAGLSRLEGKMMRFTVRETS